MAVVRRKRFWAIAATVAAGLALPVGAHAQFFGRSWGYQPQPYFRSAPPSGGGFFSFPFFGRPRSYSPPTESYHAPPPRKLETQPPSTVVVIGDSMADWLAYGLEDIYADNGQIGVVRNVRTSSGLIHYEPRNDALQWPQAIKDLLATEKPNAIVIMLGLNDRVPLRERAPAPVRDGKADSKSDGKSSAPPATAQAVQHDKAGKSATEAPPDAAAKPDQQAADTADARRPVPNTTYDFRTDQWAELYKKRIDDMIAAAKSKGVPVVWVGLPAVRGPRATSDMSYLDDLYHAEADKDGITYVDIWDGFVDENGRYTVEGPDFDGQIRRLRTGDGVHFTKYGALKLAHLVDQQLSRIMANPAAVVALPSPQVPATAKPGTTRPAIGPVLPLTTAGGGNEHLNGVDGGNLLGGGGDGAALVPEDQTAKNVLVRGDPLAAPAGRADNFAWPPSDGGANATPPANTPAAH